MVLAYFSYIRVVCKFLFKCSVPMILDRIVGSTSQSAGDLTPLVPDVTLQLNYELLLFRGPLPFLDTWIQLVTTFRGTALHYGQQADLQLFSMFPDSPRFVSLSKLTFCPRPVSTSPGWPFSQPLELWRKTWQSQSPSGNERLLQASLLVI